MAIAGSCVPAPGIEWEATHDPHLIDKNLVERANTVLLLGILWAALAVCVLGALAYDILNLLEGW